MTMIDMNGSNFNNRGVLCFDMGFRHPAWTFQLFAIHDRIAIAALSPPQQERGSRACGIAMLQRTE